MGRSGSLINIGGRQYPQGSFVVSGRAATSASLLQIARQANVPIRAGSFNTGNGIGKKRIGLWVSIFILACDYENQADPS